MCIVSAKNSSCVILQVRNMPPHGAIYRSAIARMFRQCGKGKALFFEESRFVGLLGSVSLKNPSLETREEEMIRARYCNDRPKHLMGFCKQERKFSYYSSHISDTVVV